MKKLVLIIQLLMVLMFIITSTVCSQSIASRKQWQFNMDNSDQAGADRINKIIEESTGKFSFCAGESEQECNGTLASLPTVTRIDAKGRHISTQYYTMGNCQLPGQFDDILEEDANYLIAAGTKINPATSESALIILRIRKVNLQVVTSIMIDETMLLNFTSLQPNQVLRGPVSLQLIKNGISNNGFIISANADEPGGACQINSDDFCTYCGSVLIRLNNSFGFMNSFGSHGGGWEIYQSDANGSDNYFAQASCVTTIYNSSNMATGFVFTGSQLETPGGVINRDILVVRTDIDGSVVWINTYSEPSLGVTYSDNLPDDLICTDGTLSTNETNDERGIMVLIDDVNNQIVLLAEFDYLRLQGNITTCFNFNLINNYLDCDAALLKLDLNGSVVWSENVSHFTGIDFKPEMTKVDDGYYVGGNSISSGLICYRLLKLNNSGNPDWVRNYRGIDAGNHFTGMMTIANCKDQGLLMAGYNYSTMREDFFVLKLRSNCQMVLAANPNNWNVDGLVINNSVVWNSDMMVKGIVRIAAGGSLRIDNNAVISFANSTELNDFDFLASNNFVNPFDGNSEPTRLIVEPGGQLIIEEGATLKGIEACLGEFMWEGIELLGNPVLPQFPTSNQGYCAIRNSSSIMNAVIGVAVGRVAYHNTRGRIHITTDDGGGILQIAPVTWPLDARSGIFIDCRNSIQFAPYEYNPIRPTNRSLFHIAEFYNYQAMADPEYMDEGMENFVTLNRVHGLRFYGTKFRKDYIFSKSIETGIMSFESNFFVDRSFIIVDQYGNNMGQQCKFYGLQNGIKVQNAISTVNFRVKGSYFDMNYVGIYAQNVNFMEIFRNEFGIQFLNSWGVYVGECTAYRIEENVFNGGVQFAGGNQAGSGVVFLRFYMNQDLDIIYKNEFYGLMHGIFSYGYLNGNATGAQGLKIVCNNFSGNHWDNFVGYWPLPCAAIPPLPGNVFCPGVSVEQGSFSEPCRNTFDQVCDFFNEKFNNQTPNNVVDYFFNQPSDDTDPQYCRFRILPTATGFQYIPDDCPTRIDISGHPERLSITQHADTALVLESLIDGGNKEALLTLIENGTAQQILNALLQYSPYLSEHVLIKMMEEAGLNPLDMADIILQNSADSNVPQPEPDPVTNEIESLANAEEVINKIEELPITPLLKNILLEAQAGRSAKQALQTEINRYKAKSRFNLNDCIRYFLNDTVCETAKDSLMDLLRDKPSFLYIRTMIENHLLVKQFDSAEAKWNLLYGNPDYENYIALMSYLIDIGRNGQYVEYLREDNQGKELIESIAQDSLKAGYAAARSILSHVFGYLYPVELPEGEPESQPRLLKPVKDKLSETMNSSISVQPNPFAGQA